MLLVSKIRSTTNFRNMFGYGVLSRYANASPVVENDSTVPLSHGRRVSTFRRTLKNPSGGQTYTQSSPVALVIP